MDSREYADDERNPGCSDLQLAGEASELPTDRALTMRYEFTRGFIESSNRF